MISCCHDGLYGRCREAAMRGVKPARIILRAPRLAQHTFSMPWVLMIARACWAAGAHTWQPGDRWAYHPASRCRRHFLHTDGMIFISGIFGDTMFSFRLSGAAAGAISMAAFTCFTPPAFLLTAIFLPFVIRHIHGISFAAGHSKNAPDDSHHSFLRYFDFRLRARARSAHMFRPQYKRLGLRARCGITLPFLGRHLMMIKYVRW